MIRSMAMALALDGLDALAKVAGRVRKPSLGYRLGLLQSAPGRVPLEYGEWDEEVSISVSL